PYHGDYLYHYDRAVDAQRAVAADATTAWPTALTIDASGTAARLMPGAPVVVEGGGQAVLEEVRLDSLVPETALPLAGRPAPPWSREGWFHAYRLMAGAVSDPQVRTQAAGPYHRRLESAGRVHRRVRADVVGGRRRSCPAARPIPQRMDGQPGDVDDGRGRPGPCRCADARLRRQVAAGVPQGAGRGQNHVHVAPV